MTRLKDIFTRHRENLQLLYGIFMIILIPSLIAYNTVFIIDRYNEGMNTALRRQALALGRSIYAGLENSLNDPGLLQKNIESISKRNTDLEKIEILAPEGESFRVIASSQKEEIGKTLDYYYYQVAWMQPDNDALATDSLSLSVSSQNKDLADHNKDGRFWLVAMPMKDQNGVKQAILSLQVSSEVIDELTDYNRNASIYILTLTVIITIFFLLITIRLWDYVILYKKIQEVDRMKDEFISIASHELRTPLTSIKGYVSLIIEGDYGKIANKKMLEGLERIMVSTNRLENLVEDLLNVSRIEQGRLAVEMKAVETGPAIEEVISQLRITAEQKKLELIYAKDGEKTPPAYADPERLKQVLVNLIGNAIKYTETGSVTVAEEIKDDKLRIKITDTGIGISPEDQKSLFQKFYRVRSEKTESIQGTGLGLWITKQIIELMNGKIYLESIEGRGTQVTIVLELAPQKN
jgi:signal transduction histidine kinase